MLNKLINFLYDNEKNKSDAKLLLRPYFIYFLVTIVLFLLCQLDMGALTKECGAGVMLSFIVHSFIMMGQSMR